MKKRSMNNRGSITVEASIVFPVVFLAVIAIFYICMLMYQQTYVQSVANDAAERGAAMWNSPAKDMFMQRMSKIGIKDIQPYWRFHDGSEAGKSNKVIQFINYRIEEYSVMGKGNKAEIEFKPDDKIIYKKLIVVVTQKYKIPLSGLLKPFGIGTEWEVTGKAEAVISEPVEFIRNTDFLLDTAKELDNKLSGGKLGQLKEKVVGTISSLFGKLKDFTE